MRNVENGEGGCEELGAAPLEFIRSVLRGIRGCVFNVRFCIALYCILLYFNVRYCIELYFILLFCIVMYCI